MMTMMMCWGDAISLYWAHLRTRQRGTPVAPYQGSQKNKGTTVDGAATVISTMKRCFLLADFPAISQTQCERLKVPTF